FIFERITKQFDLLQAGRRASWLDCDLDLSAWTANDFEFTVGFPDGTRAAFRAALNANEPLKVEEVPTTASYVKSAEIEQSLSQFFEEHPPLFRFQNGAELTGNILVKPRSP